MSIRLIEQIWGLKLSNEGERLVLLALADNANDEGTHCFPSQRRIAWKTDLSVKAVSAIIERLENKKLVETLNKGNQHRPTSYALHLENGEKKEAFIPSAWGGDRNKPTRYATGKSLEREQAFRTPDKVNSVQSALHLSGSEHYPGGSELHLDGSELLPSSHKPSGETSVQPSVEPAGAVPVTENRASKENTKPYQPSYDLQQTETSLEGQIKNLREIPTSNGMRKILLTVNGCTCKAFGEKVDKILASYKNGDYVHVNGYAETSKYGTDFVITSGWGLEPTSNTVVHPRAVHPETGFPVGP